jgi:hypothetical protein
MFASSRRPRIVTGVRWEKVTVRMLDWPRGLRGGRQ